MYVHIAVSCRIQVMLSESGRQRRRSEYSSGFKSIEVLKKIFKRLVLVQYWSLNPQTYTAGGGGGGGGVGVGVLGGGGGVAL